MGDHRERALQAFKRAVELDSTYVVPTLHGLDLAVLLGDSATVRTFERVRMTADTSRSWEPIYRWFVAERTGDTVRAAAILDSLIEQDPQHALPVIQHVVYDGTGARFVLPLVGVLRAEAESRGQSTGFSRNVHDILLPLGHPRKARSLVDSMFSSDAELNALITRVRDALVGGGDSADADAAVRRLDVMYRTLQGDEGVRHRWRRAILRVTEPWRLAHGDTSTVRRSLAVIRAGIEWETERARAQQPAMSAAAARPWDADIDIGVVQAMYDEIAGVPTARASLMRLDSALRALDYSMANVTRREMANLVAARLLERAGEPRLALAAVRRRGDMWTPSHPYLATQLREEGRLAALVGEREQAIAAYRHYLALRFDPEPSLRAEVDEVRRELARLEGESAGR
jgi:serine/threonine-protein kinase